ncbi:GNAT family N-acetyltransferase [Haloplasma contractile]|uniref:Diamine N-acetyltransferase protein n=1 Tax=Haloplasma contractile SSD-17B TaxID=1033810 RepID=F7PRG5_9MOLU|nr:GNAT family protein [Haloplasma contractile]ERJ11709.1 diamine N-acetyltransferase protein [Haloplasma contractile SSD-17B]
MANVWNGTNIRLRPVMESDLDGYFNVKNVDTDIQRLAGSVSFPLRQSQMESFIERVTSKDGSDDVFYFIIEDKDGNVVGDLNTSDCNRRSGTFKYGLAINKEYWSKGFGSEAVQMVLNYYFNELRYQKVTVSVYSFNEQSCGFHKKLGFKEEGLLRRMAYVNGKYHDEVILGMTAEEFNALK